MLEKIWKERKIMKYKCVNELDKFMFQDAEVKKMKFNQGLMTMVLLGVAARHNNPSNDTLVDRYLDDTEIRFKSPVITRFLLEGAKYYDANNVLQREVPDQDISENQYKEIFQKMQEDGKVFVVTPKPAKNGGECCCEIAVDVEEDTYWVEVEFEKAVVEWEHFLNKVQA